MKRTKHKQENKSITRLWKRLQNGGRRLMLYDADAIQCQQLQEKKNLF